MSRLVAHGEESLVRLAGYVHDAWFDVRQIRQEGSVVSIPVALRGLRVKKRLLPEFVKPPGSYESSLTIRGVSDFAVDGPEQIGVCEIDHFTFEPPRLTILAEPNCTVTFEVSELEVECELRMAPYEWSAPGATALAIPLAAAEPIIGPLRRAHTPSGRDGMTAHATLIAPFVHASQLLKHDMGVIREALAPFEAFVVTLASFGSFEDIGCLYLEPEPPESVVAMSEALLRGFPEVEYPPEGKAEIVPHVTIGGRLTWEQQQEIRRELAPRLPVEARAERVVLVERGEDGRWFDREVFPL